MIAPKMPSRTLDICDFSTRILPVQKAFSLITRRSTKTDGPRIQAKLRHTRDGDRRDDFDIRQEWWTGDALPDAKVVRRELAGIPRVEVAGLSKERVEGLFWDTITQVRADLAGVPRK
jgi:hypothetical protein